MKRTILTILALFVVGFVGLQLFLPTNSQSSESLQFEGWVKDDQGDPALQAVVKCYQVSPGPTTLKGSGQVNAQGNYQISGNNNDFPDAYYKLVAKEGESDEGSRTLYHYQSQSTTANITLGRDIVE